MAAILSPDRHLRSLPVMPVRRHLEPVPVRRHQDLLGARPGLVLLGLAFALLVVVGGAIAIGRGGLASLAPAPPAAAAAAASTAGAHTVVVQPGDTLWSIARRLQPTGDVRPLVDHLLATHGPAALQPGEVMTVGA